MTSLQSTVVAFNRSNESIEHNVARTLFVLTIGRFHRTYLKVDGPKGVKYTFLIRVESRLLWSNHRTIQFKLNSFIKARKRSAPITAHFQSFEPVMSPPLHRKLLNWPFYEGWKYLLWRKLVSLRISRVWNVFNFAPGYPSLSDRCLTTLSMFRYSLQPLLNLNFSNSNQFV